jgi:chorismate mutase
MNDNRHKIDYLDEQIMTLLNQRFQIVKEIGRFKQQQGLPIANRERELAVLSKADSYLYDQEIKMVYETLFQESRNLQTFTYGLIGKHLPYTDSPALYQAMGLNQYRVIETMTFRKPFIKFLI